MSIKGSGDRTQNHKRAGETMDRVFGAKPLNNIESHEAKVTHDEFHDNKGCLFSLIIVVIFWIIIIGVIGRLF
jgi:hypothetical protein